MSKIVKHLVFSFSLLGFVIASIINLVEAMFLHINSFGSDQDTIKVRYRNMSLRYSTVQTSVGHAEEHPMTSKFKSVNSLGLRSNHGVEMPKISLREIRVQGNV